MKIILLPAVVNLKVKDRRRQLHACQSHNFHYFAIELELMKHDDDEGI